MKSKVFMDEFGVEDEIWGDHMTDGGEGTAVADPPAEGEKPAGEEGDGKGEGDPPAETEEKMVPLAAMEAERGKRQQAENNFTLLQQQVVANMQNQQTQKPEPVSEVDSLDDEAIVNGREVKKIVNSLKKSIDKELQHTNSTNRASNAVLLAKASHPDYEEVIKTNLVNVLNANPALREAIAGARPESQPTLAYTIGIMDPAYIASRNAGTASDIKAKIKANAAKPGSVNSAGGAANKNDLASVIATESQADFNKRVAAVKARG